MESQFRQIIRQKIADSLALPVPALTRRDVWVPGVAGKAIAVIGMRRAGKTCMLWQELADRLAAGVARSALLYFSFEDERLAGMQAKDLDLVVEEYYRQHPEHRGPAKAVFFLDEIQLVPGWETFVRRILDTENVDVFLSGSSARMLSREIASSMRGRAMEALVRPFSFVEALRHAGQEPPAAVWPDKRLRSTLDKALLTYLESGDFRKHRDWTSAAGRNLCARMWMWSFCVISSSAMMSLTRSACAGWSGIFSGIRRAVSA